MDYMESLMGRLISRPKAGWMCAAISPKADCEALADLYCKQASHKAPNLDVMLAIEHHVRSMAQVHFFDREDVTNGLSRIEKARDYHMKQRAKARRAARRAKPC